MDNGIAIVTPVYKGNEYLPQLLHLIEKAARKIAPLKVNWILVNDSPNIKIISLKTRANNLIISKIDNPYNLGIQKTRITGLKYVKSKYVMFLDQDDKISESAFKLHLKNIKNSDISVMNGYEVNSERSEQCREKFFNTIAEMETIKEINYYFYLGNFIVSPGMVLLRTKAIPDFWKENSLKVNGADDWLLWVLMIQEGHKFSLNLTPTYIHVRNNSNVSNNTEKMIESTSEALDIFLRKYPKEKRLYKIGKRRLNFWKRLQLDNENKYKLYLLNPDISFYAFKKKIKRIF